jgi:hypothetical protein
MPNPTLRKHYLYYTNENLHDGNMEAALRMMVIDLGLYVSSALEAQSMEVVLPIPIPGRLCLHMRLLMSMPTWFLSGSLNSTLNVISNSTAKK